VQWDTSEHDWLEGRGEKLYLIAMIDDATSRLFARFVRQAAPNNSLITARDAGTDEIYALDWETP
jgi:hypothetical protein